MNHLKGLVSSGGTIKEEKAKRLSKVTLWSESEIDPTENIIITTVNQINEGILASP